MSSVYVSEPPTNGKVLLSTSKGDIDIELFSKEAPKACRNFIQLCLEGYYNHNIFHRVIKGTPFSPHIPPFIPAFSPKLNQLVLLSIVLTLAGFIVQTGDPSGTGQGGESVYGEPFKDEFHPRLRFNRRGIVGMANAGPHGNGSQFFITLGPCPELNQKHTIFGKITGDTIFNVLKIGESQTGENDRPEDPPKVVGCLVLNNPFSDIIPRVIFNEISDLAAGKPSRGKLRKKNTLLLSFGDDEEEEDQDPCSKKVKILSSHDLLKDKTLSSEPAIKPVHSAQISPIQPAPNKHSPPSLPQSSAPVDELKNSMKEKYEKYRKNTVQKDVSSTKIIPILDPTFPPAQKDENIQQQSIDENSSFSCSRNDFEQQPPPFIAKTVNNQSEADKKKAKADREKETLAYLKMFSETMKKGAQQGDSDKWYCHKLVFQDVEEGLKGVDPNHKDDDNWEIVDPRLRRLKHHEKKMKRKNE